jgi:hypothetical protein
MNKPGFVSVTRTRGLDAIPFTRSLKFDLEVWHWAAARMTYAAAYSYAQPGSRGSLAADRTASFSWRGPAGFALLGRERPKLEA